MHLATAAFLGSLTMGICGTVLVLLSRNPEMMVFLPLLGLGILVVLAAALRCASWPDVFFSLALFAFVWMPLCYLAVFPEVFSYIDGLHRHALISSDSVLRGAQSCGLAMLGWTTGRLALGAQHFRSFAVLRSVPAGQALALLAWFALSILVQAAMAISGGFGVATVEARGNFAGYFYYLLPADALALAFAAMLGGRVLDRRLAAVALALLVGYWSMKLLQGWKGAFVQSLVAFALFASVRAGWVVRPRLLGMALLVVAAYFVVIKPVGNIVRISNATGVSWSEAAEGYAGLRALFAQTSSVQTRLTEGTVNALLAHDVTGNWEEAIGGPSKIVRDALEGIIPGDFFGERNFARIFTEDVLGQPSGVESTFAGGLIGTAYAIDSAWGGFVLGLMLAAAVSALALMERMSPYPPLSIFIAAAAALFCVEAVTEGGTGRIEQVLVWSSVLWAALLAVERLGALFRQPLRTSPRMAQGE